MRLRGKRVLFLSVNGASTDARAMKEAKALVSEGAEVHFFGRHAEGLAEEDFIEGVRIRRIPDKRWVKRKDRDLVLNYLPNDLRVILKPWIDDLERFAFLPFLITALKNKLLRYLKPNFASLMIKPYARLSSKTFYIRYPLHIATLLHSGLDFQPDIIHAHDIYPLPAALALGSNLGVPVIYDAHELEAERVPPLPLERKNFITSIEKVAAAQGVAVVTVSHGYLKHYRNVFKKHALVMNIPSRGKGTSRSDVRSAIGFKDAPLIVYTGGVGGIYRGLDKVAEALKSLDGFHLALVGPRHAINDGWLLSVAERFGVADRIHFVDPVPADEVPRFISTADVAVCPIQDATLSYRHCMPNKLFEAAWSGLPICVSNLPDMREFVAELGIGLAMDQTDASSIAVSIETAYRNRENFRMSPVSRKALETKYSWSTQSERLVSLYCEMLNVDPDVNLAAIAADSDAPSE